MRNESPDLNLPSMSRARIAQPNHAPVYGPCSPILSFAWPWAVPEVGRRGSSNEDSFKNSADPVRASSGNFALQPYFPLINEVGQIRRIRP